MSVLEHLDELRVRLVRVLVVFLVALGASWFASEQALTFLLQPIRAHLGPRGDITFLTLTEPFVVRMKVSALLALFAAAPYVLWELWRFVSPGLYRTERRFAAPFLLFGSLAFFAGGAFGYWVAVPQAASWLLALGQEWRPAITLGSAFTFESRIILAMGAVFELPILIWFLARLRIVTARQLLAQFRVAVLVISIAAAVVTPTGDMVTMSLFVVPMVLLYLLGIAVAWFAVPEPPREPGA